MSKIDELMRQGLQLHQSGRNVDAEAIYRRVLDKQPSHAAANHLLGVSLLQRGDAAAAVTHLQRAVHVRPGDAEYLGNLGTALNAIGNSREAVVQLQKSLTIRSSNAGFLNNLGMALRALGRVDDAVATYRAAIVERPNEAGFHRNLGNSLMQIAEFHAAIEAFQAALRLRPDFQNALLGLVHSLISLDRRDEAVLVARDFVNRFPGMPEASDALAMAYQATGNFAAAISTYRAAIATNADNVGAHRLLGLLVARNDHDGEVGSLERLAKRTDFTESQRAQVQFALGQATADLGRHQQSFEHYAAANGYFWSQRPFDLQNATATLDSLTSAFDDGALPPLLPPTGPVFIVGPSRGGKSTLEALLAADSQFQRAGEVPLLATLTADLIGRNPAGLYAPEFVAVVRQRLVTAYARIAPARRLIDTLPNNFRLVGLLRMALPESRVLFTVRDPVRQAIATYQKYFSQGGNEFSSHLPTALSYIKAYQAFAAHWTPRLEGFAASVDVSCLQLEAWGTLLGLLGSYGSADALPAMTGKPRQGTSTHSEDDMFGPYRAALG